MSIQIILCVPADMHVWYMKFRTLIESLLPNLQIWWRWYPVWNRAPTRAMWGDGAAAWQVARVALKTTSAAWKRLMSKHKGELPQPASLQACALCFVSFLYSFFSSKKKLVLHLKRNETWVYMSISITFSCIAAMPCYICYFPFRKLDQ